MRFLKPLLLIVSTLSLTIAGCAPNISLTAKNAEPEPQISLSDRPEESIEPAVGGDQLDDTALDLSGGALSSINADMRPSAVIRDDVADLLDALPEGAEAAFVVVDLDDGDVIAEHDANQSLIPASTMKLATALVALDVLGPSHQYETELHANGPIANGLLDGDLILRGGGDPLFDVADLIAMARDLRRRGIHQISGRFLIDDSLLPVLSEIEQDQPQDAPYNPGLSALSLAFNRVHLSWRSKEEPDVTTVPFLDEAWFEKEARSELPPSGIQLKERKDGRVLWQLADRGSRRSKRALPVKDPGLHTGNVFASMAAMYGIDLPPPERASLPPETRLIAAHRSRPLRELVRDMLWYSNNLMAELIGLSIAIESEPDVQSLEDSINILRGHLTRLVPDVEWSEVALNNHSGLDSQARMTPFQLAAILEEGWHQGSLDGLLPVSGWSGTLAKRFAKQDEALRIWAKTGSLNYADGLAGFMLSPIHGPAAFAIMVSDFDARQAYDASPRRTRQSETKADRWHLDVQKVVDQIIGDWLLPMPTRTADASS